MDKKEIKAKYDELYPLYMRLGDNVKNALRQFLNDLNIDYLDVEFRVKAFESFYEKIERKKYQDPFEDVQDICGLRIINYYPADLEKITALIKKEFNVSESVDKQDELEDDRFGYRSYHFIATIKNEWLTAPNYRGLSKLTFEVQARTILMHGWAAINHKLLYKHEEDIPKQFKRDLFRLSALIELADEQFERLRNERELYGKELINKTQDGIIIDPTKTLNVDSVKVILNNYFPERKGYDKLSEIVQKIRDCHLDLNTFHEKLLLALPYLEKIEKEEMNLFNFEEDTENWSLMAVVITILDITVPGYLEDNGHMDEIDEISFRYRRKILGN
ncbi:MAG: hypothetical protein PHO27_07535 [Sulfuricurvum sp.]|nr:hypothetical protein [Sulfuricurvum sp.]